MSASCLQGTAGDRYSPSEGGGGNPQRARRKGGGRPIIYRRIMICLIYVFYQTVNCIAAYVIYYDIQQIFATKI
jgi:hypothetical protein